MRSAKRLRVSAFLVCCSAFAGCSDVDADHGLDGGDATPRAAPLELTTAFTSDPEPLTACPETTLKHVTGTKGQDVLASVSAQTCITSSLGNDSIVLHPGHHHTTVLTGTGDDKVVVKKEVFLSRTMLGSGNDRFYATGDTQAAAAWGEAGSDRLTGGAGPDEFDGGTQDDQLRGHDGDDRLNGGWGDDFVDGGLGNDLLWGDLGKDELLGGDGSDFIDGGSGHDVLDGGLGRDRLFGQSGNDDLRGGKGRDTLIPGAGVDTADAGPGDDLVVILHACQVGDGESLDGGPGHDTLLTPLPVDELERLGVHLDNFETIRQFPADGFDCDPEKCECGLPEHPPNPRALPCDYSSAEYELTPDEQAKAEQTCQDFLADFPALLDTLPPIATTADAEALISASWGASFAPARIAQFGDNPSYPHEPDFPPTEPMPNVTTSDAPCDMPDLDLHVGVAQGGINNCSSGEREAVDEALEHSKFMIFRMGQQIDAVLSATTVEQARALWRQGSQDEDDWGRFALSYWFGTYDEARAKVVQSTVRELEEIFYADDDPLFHAFRHNVQCFHRLDWWQYILYGATSPLTVAFKTFANACFYNETAGHATFAVPFGPGVTAAAHVGYPFESIELCGMAFTQDFAPPERIGGIIMHELLHFHRNSAGRLKDRHGDIQDAFCSGNLCYDEENARSLAEFAPNTAVMNIDNYRVWANTTSTLYTDGYCDDTTPGLCFTSSCCGDGILQPELSEFCDTSDFGAASCLTEAGFSEGELDCSADCQTVGDSDCTGSCGNGAIDPALDEACDGQDFGTQSCASLYGSDSGSLGCSNVCTLETGNCEGSPPGSYLACGVEPGSSCFENPEECHLTPGAGDCTGGPCERADPTGRTEGQSDPHAVFHPRGNFRDSEGNLYLCRDSAAGPRTCIDEEGFGVCKQCGTQDGQTMLGCPCSTSNECGLDLQCFGGNFPHGGFCWTDAGPPDFQCEQGACGQEFWGPDGGSYCEHYPPTGNARCMPSRCDDIAARECAQQDFICDTSGHGCATECAEDSDCVTGWPGGTQCTPDLECAM